MIYGSRLAVELARRAASCRQEARKASTWMAAKNREKTDKGASAFLKIALTTCAILIRIGDRYYKAGILLSAIDTHCC